MEACCGVSVWNAQGLKWPQKTLYQLGFKTYYCILKLASWTLWSWRQSGGLLQLQLQADAPPWPSDWTLHSSGFEKKCQGGHFPPMLQPTAPHSPGYCHFSQEPLDPASSSVLFWPGVLPGFHSLTQCWLYIKGRPQGFLYSCYSASGLNHWKLASLMMQCGESEWWEEGLGIKRGLFNYGCYGLMCVPPKSPRCRAFVNCGLVRGFWVIGCVPTGYCGDTSPFVLAFGPWLMREQGFTPSYVLIMTSHCAAGRKAEETRHELELIKLWTKSKPILVTSDIL